MKKNYDESGLVDYIRTLRKEKNITQEEVANRLGISRGMYVRIEGGLSPCLPYLEGLINIIGEDLNSYFPYDINYYTNQRLFLYMLLFGIDCKDVADALELKTNQVKNLLKSARKKYLIQYKEEMDELFPDLYEVDLKTKIRLAGKNSVIVKIEKKEYIFLNAAGKKTKDTFIELVNK